jgi:hypothetical protein
MGVRFIHLLAFHVLATEPVDEKIEEALIEVNLANVSVR